ncbi:hypothetical protein MA16_Dca016449 [Dendrobium catenatum]|uniref:Uncharacterized protein n=1 Tax=Dendrobium catenatum TaxID=906689 RepID=A0A2I0VYM3_9ASPA|nr:hypothetical protein MA16_Dca016449 [Dendrobium catenatum]
MAFNILLGSLLPFSYRRRLEYTDLSLKGKPNRTSTVLLVLPHAKTPQLISLYSFIYSTLPPSKALPALELLYLLYPNLSRLNSQTSVQLSAFTLAEYRPAPSSSPHQADLPRPAVQLSSRHFFL